MTGQVVLHGRDVTGLPPEARGIGVLFQKAVLFPHLAVADNLRFGLSPAVTGRRGGSRSRVRWRRRPGRDGRARAALMRTLLARPQAVLLDEPFSSLDPGRRHDIRPFVLTTIRNSGIPALLVAHDDQDARAAGGPVIALN